MSKNIYDEFENSIHYDGLYTIDYFCFRVKVDKQILQKHLHELKIFDKDNYQALPTREAIDRGYFHLINGVSKEGYILKNYRITDQGILFLSWLVSERRNLYYPHAHV